MGLVLAEFDGVGVGDVLSGGGGRPGVVLAPAELHVHADAREGGAPGADARALDLLEHQQLRREVAGLRSEDGDRVAARGAAAGDEQGVGHPARLADVEAGQRAAVEDPLERLEPLGDAHVGLGLGEGRAGAVVDELLGRDRAGVGQRGAARVRGLGGVREAGAVVDGERGLGVVALAERLPDLGALRDAVLGLRGLERERGLHLAATAPAEQSADDGGERDQVGDLERLDLADVGDGVDLAGEDVLAGEVPAVLGLLGIGVDAVHVRLRVGHRLLAARAVGGADPVDLGLEVGLGVRGLRPELLLQALVGEGAARERGELTAPDVPEQVHQPEPVLTGRVPGAVLGSVAGGALDVRDPGGLVAGDGDVGARGAGGGHLAAGHPERGVVEEGVELVVGERGLPGDERVVLAELVVAVRGMGAEGLVAEDLDEGGVAVLAGRQDVAAAPQAVVAVGRFGGIGRAEGASRAAARAITVAAVAVLSRAVGRRMRAPSEDRCGGGY